MPVTRFLLILLVLLNLLALAATRGWLGDSVQRGEPERLTNQLNPQAIALLEVGASEGAPASEPPPAPPKTDSKPESGASEDAREPPSPAPAPQPTEPPNEMSAPAEVLQSAMPVPLADTSANGAPLIESAPAPEPTVPSPAQVEMACIVYETLGEQQAATLGRSAMAIRTEVRTTRRMTAAAGNWWVHIPAPASRTVAEDRVEALRAAGIRDLFIVRDEGPHKNAISLGMFRTENGANQHLADLRARRVTDARVIARKPAVFALEVRGSLPDIAEVTKRLQDNPYGVVARECER